MSHQELLHRGQRLRRGIHDVAAQGAVHVQVDETRNDAQPAGVDDPIGGGQHVACQPLDVAVLDNQCMPVECLVGSEQAAASDDGSHLGGES